jgi:hypothetical protein
MVVVFGVDMDWKNIGVASVPTVGEFPWGT